MRVRVYIDVFHRRSGHDVHLSHCAPVSGNRRGRHGPAGVRVEHAAFDRRHRAVQILHVGEPGRHIDDRVGDGCAAEPAAADVHRDAAADRAFVDVAGRAAAAADKEFSGGKNLVFGMPARTDLDFAAFVYALVAGAVDDKIAAGHHGSGRRSAGHDPHGAGSHRDAGGGAVDIHGAANDFPAEGFAAVDTHSASRVDRGRGGCPAAADTHIPVRADRGQGGNAAAVDIHEPADRGRGGDTAVVDTHAAARTDVVRVGGALNI